MTEVQGSYIVYLNFVTLANQSLSLLPSMDLNSFTLTADAAAGFQSPHVHVVFKQKGL
jgi:hypothetical protein